VRKDAARRRTLRRRIHALGPRPVAPIRGRRVRQVAERALLIRIGAGLDRSAILSMDLIVDAPIPELEPWRHRPRRPRDDDRIDYDLIPDGRIEDDEVTPSATRLIEAMRGSLDRLDAAVTDPAVVTHPDAWFRTFVTLSPGTWTIPSDVVRRIAALRGNIWIDAG
jgi:hypothetical protein